MWDTEYSVCVYLEDGKEPLLSEEKDDCDLVNTSKLGYLFFSPLEKGVRILFVMIWCILNVTDDYINFVKK